MLGTSRYAAHQARAATNHSLSGPAGKAAPHLHQGLQLLLAGSHLIVVGGHNDLSGGGQLAFGCRAGRHEGQRGREPHSLGKVHVQQSSMAARIMLHGKPHSGRRGGLTREEDGRDLELNIHVCGAAQGSQAQCCQPFRLWAIVLAAAGGSAAQGRKGSYHQRR